MPEGAGTDRSTQAARFLAGAGWGAARRAPLAGDASNRRYERLHAGSATAVLMDADPARGEDVRPFLAIARHLGSLGLSAPGILSADETSGFLLLEDLGDDLFARHLRAAPDDEELLYRAAVEVLAGLRVAPLPSGIAAYDPPAMSNLAALALDWYAPGLGIAVSPDDRGDFVGTMSRLLEALAPAADPVLVLRDYHAENLIWLPRRTGLARVGLLDFQDARAGHPGYDLVSLIRDARRDVSKQAAEVAVRHYSSLTGDDPQVLSAALAVLGVQRNLRIVGVFARLSMHFGKPHYIDLLPRVRAHLETDLAHPALAALREPVARFVPWPTAAHLQRLKDLCGTVPKP